MIAASALHAIGSVIAAPSPSSTQPPGTQGLLTILDWGSWLVTFACVAGVMLVGGTMALRHRRGDGGAEAASNLGWVLGGAVLGIAAGPLVTALT